MDTARYIDVTIELNRSGGMWQQILDFLKLETLHPLRRTLHAYTICPDINHIFRNTPYDLVVYTVGSQQDGLRVHRGALGALRKMFCLPSSETSIDEEIIPQVQCGLLHYYPVLPDLTLERMRELSRFANTFYYDILDEFNAGRVTRHCFDKVDLISTILDVELRLYRAAHAG